VKEKALTRRDQSKVEVQPEPSKILELAPRIYQFRGEKPGSHVYLIKGNTKNVLIDTGVAGKFPVLKRRFTELDMRVKDVNLIILTHEHYDHIGATAFFQTNWSYRMNLSPSESTRTNPVSPSGWISGWRTVLSLTLVIMNFR